MSKGELFSASLVPPAMIYVCKWMAKRAGVPVVMHDGAPASRLIEVRLAGSARRRAPLVRDIDLVVALPHGCPVPSEAWANDHMRFVQGGEHAQKWLYADSIPIELYLTDHRALGATLLYATGSKEFNVWMRGEAKKQGLKLSQWGLFRDKELLASETERDIFRALGLPFVDAWRRAAAPVA